MSMERIGPINRRQALKRVGALAVPVLSGYHPLVPVQEGGAAWEPRFFNTREAELVAELSEHIIRRPTRRAPKPRTSINMSTSS